MARGRAGPARRGRPASLPANLGGCACLHAMAAKGNDRATREAALASEHGNKYARHMRRAEVGNDLLLRTVFSLTASAA